MSKLAMRTLQSLPPTLGYQELLLLAAVYPVAHPRLHPRKGRRPPRRSSTRPPLGPLPARSAELFGRAQICGPATSAAQEGIALESLFRCRQPEGGAARCSCLKLQRVLACPMSMLMMKVEHHQQQQQQRRRKRSEVKAARSVWLTSRCTGVEAVRSAELSRVRIVASKPGSERMPSVCQVQAYKRGTGTEQTLTAKPLNFAMTLSSVPS